MPQSIGYSLNTIPHCLEWYKLVLRTRLPLQAPAVLQLISNVGLRGDLTASRVKLDQIKANSLTIEQYSEKNKRIC